jgi:hypothetical protein
MRSLPHDPRKLAAIYAGGEGTLAAAYCAATLLAGYVFLRIGIGLEERRVGWAR